MVEVGDKARKQYYNTICTDVSGTSGRVFCPRLRGSLGDLEEIKDVFLEEGMLDLDFDGLN